MGRCWSCGSSIPGGLRYIITCPTCSIVEQQKEIRKSLESSGAQSLYVAVEAFKPYFSEVTGVLEAGFAELSEQLTDIASIFEWGFEEIGWKLDQTNETLSSIDKTLKLPSQTQANEWRQIADELRRRGILDESEKFFLKSLETNPLDYRTYIGLGKTCLQLGDGIRARAYWEKSLPHAPKGEIDYRSYSYRLIGRTYFCEDNPQQAASTLRTAIELSPNYYLGYYDYAQYCALTGDKENCLYSLWIAVVKEPIPLELVRKERNFEVFREEIENLLKGLTSEELREIDFQARLGKLGKRIVSIVREAERKFAEAKEVILRLHSEEEINTIIFQSRHEWVYDFRQMKDVWRPRQTWLSIPAYLIWYEKACSCYRILKEGVCREDIDRIIRTADYMTQNTRLLKETLPRAKER